MRTIDVTFPSVSRLSLIAASLVLGVICVVHLHADEPKNQPPDDASGQKFDDTASVERLAVMRRRIAALTAECESNDGLVQVDIISSPLLRYSNQASKVVMLDATVWAWGRVGRPVALASVEPDGFEVVSLSERPVSFTGKRGLKWKATASDIKWKPVPNADKPGATALIRVRQMKEITARFSAAGYYGDGTDTELRLLVRHLHRYADPDNKLIDGAIFTFAGGTNPEVILLLECRESIKDQSAWFYGICRLRSGRLVTKLDDLVVWECQGIGGWSDRAPYTSLRFDPDDKVLSK